MNSQFGNKIRIVIEEQKMLLLQLATFLDMNTAQLSKIERGVSQFTLIQMVENKLNIVR